MDDTVNEGVQPSETPESSGFPQAAAKPAAKPRPSRAKTAKADDETSDETPKQATGRDGERLIDITLHDSPEIPPNGQFIGVNGRQYILKPGVRTSVPVGVVDVLDNAVHSVPEMDDRMRVVGWRSAPRLTYTLHRD